MTEKTRVDPRPFLERVRGLFAPARITLIDDSGTQRRLQVTVRTGETEDDIIEYQAAGLRHKIKGQTLLIRFGGFRRNTMAICTDAGQMGAQYLNDGDVALDDYRGLYIQLSAAGIVIQANNLPVTIVGASKLRAECPIESTGEITANCDSNPIPLSTHLTTGVQSGSEISGPPKA
jgi:phage gp45-like